MMIYSLVKAAECPAAFRSHLKVEWYGRTGLGEGEKKWVEHTSSFPDFNGPTEMHEDLGVVLALAERLGVELSEDSISPMARGWANNTITFGAHDGAKVVIGWTFGMQWRVSVR